MSSSIVLSTFVSCLPQLYSHCFTLSPQLYSRPFSLAFLNCTLGLSIVTSSFVLSAFLSCLPPLSLQKNRIFNVKLLIMYCLCTHRLRSTSPVQTIATRHCRGNLRRSRLTRCQNRWDDIHPHRGRHFAWTVVLKRIVILQLGSDIMAIINAIVAVTGKETGWKGRACLRIGSGIETAD